MIHVDKPAIDDQQRWTAAELRLLSKWSLDAETEVTANTRCFIGAKKRKGMKTSFNRYGDDIVRNSLNRIFGFKCAYCEFPYGTNQPVAIEHFRPKGPVVEGKEDIPPGYYWLAAAWSNLLPSCTDCNSERYHRFGPEEEEKRGKAQQFPLANPRQRAIRKGEEARERALLLDPSRDFPEMHLEFLAPTGIREKLGLIRPALVAPGTPSDMGLASIRVFGLDRPELIAQRAKHAQRALGQLRHVEKAAAELERAPRNRGLHDQLVEEIEALFESFLAPDCEFLGMVRQIVHPRTRALIRRQKLKRFAAEFASVLP